MFRFIFIAILFFLLLRLVLKVFAAGKRRTSQFRDERSQRKRKEGEMHVDYTPDQDKRGNKKEEGEFIDYEEIQ